VPRRDLLAGLDDAIVWYRHSRAAVQAGRDAERLPGHKKPGAIAGKTDTLDELDEPISKVLEILNGSDRRSDLNGSRLQQELILRLEARGAGPVVNLYDLLLQLLEVREAARWAHRVHAEGNYTDPAVYRAVKALMATWEQSGAKSPHRKAGFVADAMALIDPELSHDQIENARKAVRRHRFAENRQTRVKSTP
jgi:hypothetical protein